MLAAAIIIFRETLEAALLVGIIAAATRAIPGRTRWIWGGIAAGAAGAGLVALSAGPIAGLFEGMGQEIFNAAVLAVAIALLAWHQIWMSAHGKELAQGARQVAADVREGRKELSAVLAVIALAVLREGSESVLFLYGLLSGGETSSSALLSGGIAGLAAGSALGAILYVGMLRIPLRWFFSTTSVLILLLAAGMASKMAQLLIQADVLPGLMNPLWDTSALIPGDSALGVLMHALAGYDPRPAATQVLSYVATALLMLGGMWLTARSTSSGPKG
jgi:high-affinity iron transporter